MVLNVVLLVVAVVVAHMWALIIDEPNIVDNRERAATTHPHAYFDLYVCVVYWRGLLSRLVLPGLFVFPALPCVALPHLAFINKQGESGKRKKGETEKEGKRGREKQEEGGRRERKQNRKGERGEGRKEETEKGKTGKATARKGGREKGRKGEREKARKGERKKGKKGNRGKGRTVGSKQRERRRKRETGE